MNREKSIFQLAIFAALLSFAISAPSSAAYIFNKEVAVTGGEIMMAATQPILIIDSYLGIARGDISGVGQMNEFGRNPDVDSATGEDVWGYGGLYPYLSSAETLSVVSTDADDDGSPAGTGARTVTVYCLDGSYAETSQTITLDGTTPVVTSISCLRTYRAMVATAGTTQTNEGAITFTSSSTAQVQAQISNNCNTSVGCGQTLMAIYTVPAGKTAYMVHLAYNILKKTSATSDCYFFCPPVWRGLAGQKCDESKLAFGLIYSARFYSVSDVRRKNRPADALRRIGKRCGHSWRFRFDS